MSDLLVQGVLPCTCYRSPLLSTGIGTGTTGTKSSALILANYLKVEKAPIKSPGAAVWDYYFSFLLSKILGVEFLDF